MRNWFLHWTISQKIVASFILLIVTGSVLLWLPISQAFGSQATYFDHFFHSASLVTVTGDDLEKMHEICKASAYETGELKGLSGGTPYYFFVTDPDGYRIEVKHET